MEALHRQVLPFLLRRIKEDVLQDLPPKIIQDYQCDLSPLQVSSLTYLLQHFSFVSIIILTVCYSYASKFMAVNLRGRE